MKQGSSERKIAAKKRTAKKPGGKGRLERRLSGKATQKVVVPNTQSLAKRIVVGQTPSSLASILAERVAAAR